MTDTTMTVEELNAAAAATGAVALADPVEIATRAFSLTPAEAANLSAAALTDTMEAAATTAATPDGWGVIGNTISDAHSVFAREYAASAPPTGPALRAYTAEPAPEPAVPEPAEPPQEPGQSRYSRYDSFTALPTEVTLSFSTESLASVQPMTTTLGSGIFTDWGGNNRINLQEYSVDPEPEPIRINGTGAAPAWSTGGTTFSFRYPNISTISLEPAEPAPAPKPILKPIRKTRRVLNLTVDGWVVK